MLMFRRMPKVFYSQEEDVVRFVNEFFTSGFFPKGCNSSFITLIPKVSNARNIIDCPFILNEVLEWYRNHKEGLMVFKVDFEKAFDYVRCDFLDSVLDKMGFGSKWRTWIRSCFSSARSSVFVNGSPTPEFDLQRGFRQGDPLSPFLFILAMEGLHTLSCKAEELGLFKGASFSRDNMTVSHLMYADDVIFLCEWSETNARNLICLLRCFFLMSGLKINVHKSYVLGVGVSDMEVSNVAKIIGRGVAKLPMKYLGVPVGSNMASLTLIKVVHGNLHTYYLSVYKLPSNVQHKLESIRNNFFISVDQGEKNITWVKWKKCLASKSLGGLRIGSIYGLNMGLLFKCIWRLLANPSDLWSQSISSIYGAHGGIDLLSFCTRIIGNGDSTKFWDDLWCGEQLLKYKFHRIFMLDSDRDCLVANRIPLSNWHSVFRRNPRGGVESFQFEALQDALKDVVLSDHRDSWKWSLDNSAGFSVASVRRLIDSRILVIDQNATSWNRCVPNKVNVFLWRLSLNKLPFRVNLDRKGIDVGSVLCLICQDDVESVNHIFFSCEMAKVLWDLLAKWWELDIPVCANISEWFSWLDSLHASPKMRTFLEAVGGTLLWAIWSFCNHLVFSTSPPKKALLWDSIVSQSFLWISSRNPRFLPPPLPTSCAVSQANDHGLGGIGGFSTLVLEWYRNHKEWLMVFKVDFEKAFDSVRCDFLDSVLDKIGFGSKWRTWIRSCFSSARSSILVNGSPTPEFDLQRGFRQGDPLSPFLFILAMERLHTLSCKAEELGLFKRASFSRDNMKVSHLMYADDVIFLCEWSETNAHNLICLLRCFFLMSGLKINVHKSYVLGVGVSDMEVSNMAKIIGCGVAKLPMKYLGVPVGSNMASLTLIKVVHGNLHTYYLSIYKLPSNVQHKLESIRNNFFIGVDQGEKNITWVKWKKCLASKSLGGLRIGSIYALNMGLLFKWIWRLLANPSDLWSQSISSIYGTHGALQDALKDVVLSDHHDSWKWSLDNSAGFSVALVRRLIDSRILVVDQNATRWNRCVPNKVNVFLWRLSLNKLPFRVNLDRKGIDVGSVLCPICQDDVESVNHIFFSCEMAKVLWDLLAKWWELDILVCANISEWFSWLDSLHASPKMRSFLEAVGGTLLWAIWSFCNHLVFSTSPPKKALLWDSIVSQSFLWISSRNPRCSLSWLGVAVAGIDEMCLLMDYDRAVKARDKDFCFVIIQAAVAVSDGIVASSYILAFVAAAAGTSADNTVGTVPAVDIADIAVFAGHIVVVVVVVVAEYMIVDMTVAFAAIVADSGAVAGIDIASFDCRIVGSESTQIVHYFAQDTELLIEQFGAHLARLDDLCLAVAL
ncbi:RNA-directed DNA polymerase, eukaryota, reverse transcriptase zinc-binding domain protein [Tanacetum coccineum]|uniref:RNA-directed DNA polymerase, eukaryota, reverse transcriptase zinc-binding domain protein n=1 Tax=Tanacetum coccineum TaxID=301880 RepID=A0ABQ5BJ79_9ASTR